MLLATLVVDLAGVLLLESWVGSLFEVGVCDC